MNIRSSVVNLSLEQLHDFLNVAKAYPGNDEDGIVKALEEEIARRQSEKITDPKPQEILENTERWIREKMG